VVGAVEDSAVEVPASTKKTLVVSGVDALPCGSEPCDPRLPDSRLSDAPLGDVSGSAPEISVTDVAVSAVVGPGPLDVTGPDGGSGNPVFVEPLPVSTPPTMGDEAPD
jgi:hypothetical protein